MTDPDRLPYVLTRPAVLLCGAMVVHAAGRLASLCGPGEFDSYLYCVSAYEAWQPGATVDALVSEKPAGQAVLTGWCYRLMPGAPSRLVLVPIESAFLLAAYAVFWMLARRLFGARAAAALTLFLVISYNTYNIDDGFNLNECYLALPVLVAVFAHLTIASPGRRGLVRGLGLGLSLTIKQTAIGLPLVCLLHGVMRMMRGKRYTEGTRAFGMTLVGMVVAWSPVVVFLVARGWLRVHVHDLMRLSGRHAGVTGFGLPTWDRVVPVLPLAWWGVLGVVAWVVGVIAERSGSTGTAAGCLCETEAARADGRGSGLGSARAEGCDSGLLFTLLWFAAEAAIIWAMVQPWAHYYQQIAAPAALLAGFGVTALVRRVASMRASRRMMAWRWVGATTCVLAMVAVMPLLAAASTRAPRLDRAEEVKAFARWREEWASRSIGEFFRGMVRDDES